MLPSAVQGRRALQTSDALAAAKVQVGPRALVLGAHLNKQMGLSLGHSARVLQSGYGLERSTGAAGSAGWQGRADLPSIVGARQSKVNWVDQTAWPSSR